LEELSS